MSSDTHTDTPSKDDELYNKIISLLAECKRDRLASAIAGKLSEEISEKNPQEVSEEGT